MRRASPLFGAPQGDDIQGKFRGHQPCAFQQRRDIQDLFLRVGAVAAGAVVDRQGLFFILNPDALQGFERGLQVHLPEADAVSEIRTEVRAVIPDDGLQREPFETPFDVCTCPPGDDHTGIQPADFG